MNEYNLALFITAFLLFLIFLGFLIWGIKTGQFVDIEEAKYRMLELPDRLIEENEIENHKGERI